MPDALAIFLKPTNLFFWKEVHKGEKRKKKKTRHSKEKKIYFEKVA